MKTILFVVLTLFVATTAVAGTVRENFRAAIQRKYAPDFGTLLSEGKFKALCVCNESTALRKVGALESVGVADHERVVCAVPSFGAGGTVTTTVPCTDWSPLTK